MAGRRLFGGLAGSRSEYPQLGKTDGRHLMARAISEPRAEHGDS